MKTTRKIFLCSLLIALVFAVVGIAAKTHWGVPAAMAGVDYVDQQIMYWAHVPASTTDGRIHYTVQAGAGILLGAQVDSVYTVDMPIPVPRNRRFIEVTPVIPSNSPALGLKYDEAASTDYTIVLRGYNTHFLPQDVAFQIRIWQINLQI